MKIIIISILFIMIISIAACQQAPKKEVMINKELSTETPKANITGDASVDAVGNNLNNANNVYKDLDPSQLSDLDTGLADVQNI